MVLFRKLQMQTLHVPAGHLDFCPTDKRLRREGQQNLPALHLCRKLCRCPDLAYR